MSPNDAYRMANSVDQDQTAPLIWVYTVCPDLSVRKLRNDTVHFVLGRKVKTYSLSTLSDIRQNFFINKSTEKKTKI